jgi:DNA topoisomerase-2
MVRGIYSMVGADKIRITELPVGFSTVKMVEHLKSLLEPIKDKAGKIPPPIIKDYRENNTDTQVDITVEFVGGKLADVSSGNSNNGVHPIEKLLKLTKTVSTSNMYLFDSECKLKKYTTVEAIIDEYYVVRKQMYQKRKEFQIVEIEKELLILSNRARYLTETLDGKVDLRKKTKDEITSILEKRKFDKIKSVNGSKGNEGSENSDYEYLVKMRMDSVSKENVERILKERDQMTQQLADLREKTVERIWLEELAELEKAYDKYKKARETIQNNGETSSEKSGSTSKTVSGKKKASNNS